MEMEMNLTKVEIKLEGLMYLDWENKIFLRVEH